MFLVGAAKCCLHILIVARKNHDKHNNTHIEPSSPVVAYPGQVNIDESENKTGIINGVGLTVNGKILLKRGKPLIFKSIAEAQRYSKTKLLMCDADHAIQKNDIINIVGQIWNYDNKTVTVGAAIGANQHKTNKS